MLEMNRSTSFRTAVVTLSAWVQTLIGPSEDLCSGGGTLNNLSTTCSCSQVKPQQRKSPGFCRKRLSTPVDLLQRLTVLHQMPGRRKCFQRSRASRYTQAQRCASRDPNRNASSGLLLPLFHQTPTSQWPRFSGWIRRIGEPHRFDVLVSCLHLLCCDGFVRSKTHFFGGTEIKQGQLQEGAEAFSPFASKR